MALKHQAPRGTRDLLPAEIGRWQWAEARAREVLDRYGYAEIRTPLFEDFELFARTSGEASDVVQKEMYRFKDLGDRDLALRPEGTASVCRAYLQHGLAQQGRIHRLWYMGPMFRYGRPQKGRYRQFWQVGAEIIGTAAPGADVEMIALFMDLFDTWGFKELTVAINSLGTPETRGRYAERLRAWLAPARERLSDDSRARLETNPLRVLDTKDPDELRLFEEGGLGPMPRMLEVLDEESRTHFDAVLAGLTALGIAHEIDHGLVRGLDYYTRTAFEVHDRSLGAQSALGGGGRYDGLIEALGGPSTPGVGFSIGLDRVLLMAEERGFAPEPTSAGVYIVAMEGTRLVAPMLARALRQVYTVEYDLEGRAVNAQMKAADKSGARAVMLLGEEEWQRGEVVLKDLRTSAQQTVSLEGIVEALDQLLLGETQGDGDPMTETTGSAAGVRLEGLGDWRRTHTCGELRRADASAKVGPKATLMGWVHRVRDHGGVLFVDLRDRYGITQVVFRPEVGGPEVMARAGEIGNEWVIAARGLVVLRPRDSVNADMPTGEVELEAREIRVLAAAAPLPFQVNEAMHLANEDLRLRYRYLDLRRPELSSMLALRHTAAQAARAYLGSLSFLEIETPVLVKPTPEGARDYIVPSRVHPGKFYALPQSPQLYKQTLMIAGCDRYYQFARCLRDEDLRADRQPEHTQIDLEMSFVTEEEVFNAVEGLMAAMWKEVLGVTLKTPFPRLTFRESMLRFGSDKPDVRFGLEFVDVTSICARSPRRVIADGAKAEGGIGVAMVVPGGAEISGTQLRKYEDVVKEAGGAGLTFFKVQDADREKQQVIFPGDLLDEFLRAVKAQRGDAVLFTNGPWERTLKALGVLRTQLGQPLLEGKETEWRFLWVREFPMFEWDEQAKRWAPRHHMFTMPNADHIELLETDPGKVYAQLYDVVLNGTELGSGSIRIHRTDIQERVMKVIGLSREQAYQKFGFLLEAYQFASPPHGGIGIGFDRTVMLLGQRDSLRETMAFPKSASAASLMDGSPSEVEPEQLKELRIRVEE